MVPRVGLNSHLTLKRAGAWKKFTTHVKLLHLKTFKFMKFLCYLKAMKVRKKLSKDYYM